MTAIAVTGMHRTGTSMVARALRFAGVYLGDDRDLIEPAPDNPDGFFEHAGFVRLGDDLLEATGGSWDQPPALGPMAADDARVMQLQSTARDLVTSLAVEQPWGWKDPRTCLTARFWLDLLPDVRFVVCVRHPLEVALSLKRRNQVSYTLGLTLWHTYYEVLLDAVPEGRRLVTHYDAYFGGGRSELDRIVGFAGLPPHAVADAKAALDPQLRHHRLDIGLPEAGVATATIDLYRRLCDEAGYPFEAGKRSSRATRVPRLALDLALAQQHLDERDRQVESLRRERAELTDRVTAIERTTGVASDLARVEARLDVLEAAVHGVRYQLEDLAARSDAPVVRACREMVRMHVPHEDSILVVAKGDSALLDLYGRPASNFPQDERGQYPGFAFAHSAAAVAHLEVQRVRGNRFLLIPESAAWWIDHYSAFGEHLVNRYRVAADEREAGLLVDLGARRALEHGWPRGLSDTLDRIATACGRQPAVLDWTDLNMQPHLPCCNVFMPPDDNEGLPYLNGTVDVVLVADTARLGEARRVASLAVISLEPNGGPRPDVAAVDVLAEEQLATPATLVIVDSTSPDETWLAHLREALDDEPGAELVVSSDPSTLVDAAGDAEVVAVVEDGVLPLPGCFTAARTAMAGGDRVGAVAVKLFAADGSLEAAGATIFADGSRAAVAAGSHDVAAPWHDYVRETCWGPGLMFLGAPAIDKIERQRALPAGATHAVWSSGLWAAGLRVVYQPAATAVRVVPASPTAAPVAAAIAEAWGPALQSRLDAPVVLDDRAWRELLARQDVEAGWQ
jgi:hypothetical protein